MIFRGIFTVVLILLYAGCGSEDSELSPTTGGSWYQPVKSTTWQWQLNGSINQSYSVDMYDVDLFNTSESEIDTLQQSGKKVICYFCAGSYEEYREDASLFGAGELGKVLDGWEDERWLDIRSNNVKNIMKARINLAKLKGCDGVEPDNMDGYTNESGFNLNASDQLKFNKFIANEAHKLSLSVGLKNDLDQIVELEPYYDFAVNEQCFEYNECDKLTPFTIANKPIFNAEYESKYASSADARTTLCASANSKDIRTLILPLDLNDSFRYSCD